MMKRNKNLLIDECDEMGDMLAKNVSEEWNDSHSKNRNTHNLRDVGDSKSTNQTLERTFLFIEIIKNFGKIVDSRQAAISRSFFSLSAFLWSR